jgi:hypothetical protein
VRKGIVIFMRVWVASRPGGHVYGGYDDFLIRLGTSGDDAIEGLCTGREAPQVS